MRVWIEAGVVLGFFLLLAAAASTIVERVVRPWLQRAHHTGLASMVRPLKGLITWGLVLAGVSGSVIRLQDLLDEQGYLPLIHRAIGLAWVFLAVVGIVRLLNAFFEVREHAALAESTDLQKQRDALDRTAFSRKLATGLVIGIGIVYALRALGVDTSPLLAGGAVGGVVIGLALQDSLSNVFAGLFLNIDRPVRVGEVISIGPDKEGTVEEIGWRYTKIRLLSNNLLVVPNKTFASTEITNFDRPEEPMTVSIDVGVAYDSDLDRVEQVAVAAAQKVQDKFNNPPLENKPFVRFRSLGDYSITVRVFVRSSTPLGRFLLSSELIRGIHAAFRENGIDIPFPTTRSLVYSDRNDNPDIGAEYQGSDAS